jgi:RNA polymerase sigma-70 factor (ECF subfamily)
VITEDEFTDLTHRHRHELRVHCYRMLGSYDDAEDLVQETLLKAWRGRHTYAGRASARAWLYRIATNACLDHLDKHPRTPHRFAIPATVGHADRPPTEIPWLQPYPDTLLDLAAPGDEPDALVIAKETIELSFLVAIAHLPPAQRAVFILRDVLGWSAPETGDLLDLSVAAVKSALQRARATVRDQLPDHRSEWAPDQDPSEAERAFLKRYVDVIEAGDARRMLDMLDENVIITMPPNELWFAGRDAFVTGFGPMLDPASPTYFGAWRSFPTRANRQPAVAHYVRRPATTRTVPRSST